MQLLQRKIDTLTKAMEVESKKMKREAAEREKDILLNSDNKKKFKDANMNKRYTLHHNTRIPDVLFK